ncbi:MAG: hypothetical protein ABIP50_02010 [Candidatus Saccharimonadales bacterium]
MIDANLAERLMSRRESEIVRRIGGVSDEMLPGLNYKLSLKGARISQFVIRTLEQQFSQSLDRKSGVNVDLSFNPNSEEFVVDRLAIGVDNKAVAAVIQRTDSLGYIPSLETHLPIERNFLPIEPYKNADLMGMLGINQPGTIDAASYKLWRAELLEKTRGWQLAEHVDFIRDIDPNFSLVDPETGIPHMLPGVMSSVRISNTEVYDEKPSDTDDIHLRTQAVTEIIEASLPSDDEDDRDTLHFYTSAQSESAGYDSATPMMSRTVLKTNNSLHNQLADTVTREIHSEVLPLTLESYGRFIDIVQFAERSIKSVRS